MSQFSNSLEIFADDIMPGLSKNIALGFLVCFCLVVALPVFAVDVQPQEEKPLQLEQRYPSLPIIGSLDDAQKLPPEERMGFYVKYFLNLAFFIVVGVCIAVLIAAGVAYIAASQKPALIVAAREMVRNALLGLFILGISYLVLYVINPDLLFLKFGVPEAPKAQDVGAPYEPNQVVYTRVPVPYVLKRIIQDLGEKVYLDKDNRFYEKINNENCLTDGYGNFVDEDGNYLRGDKVECKKARLSQFSPKNRFLAALVGRALAAYKPKDFVYRAEIPFFDTAKTLERAIREIEGEGKGDINSAYPGLKALLNECTCGLSKFHVEWQGLNTKCVGGEIGRNKPNICKSRVKDCGEATDKQGYYLCDLHEVQIATTTVKVAAQGPVLPGSVPPTVEKPVKLVLVRVRDPEAVGPFLPDDPAWRYLPNDWKPLDWEPLQGWTPQQSLDNTAAGRPDPLFVLKPLDPAAAKAAKIKPERLIKYRVLKLQEIMEELNSQKRMFFPKQAGFLADALTINKIKHLVKNIRSGVFTYDFQAKKEDLEKQGFEVIEEDVGEAGEAKTPAVSTTAKRPGLWQRLMALIRPREASGIAEDYELAGYDAGTFYFITHADETVAPKELVEYNKLIKRQANRANLFSVLTGLTLETIEGFFKECLTAAFGKAEYQLDKQELEEVLEQAGKEGVLARFEVELENKLAEMNIEMAMEAGIRDRVEQDVNLEFVRKYIDQCVSAGDCVKNAVDEPAEIGKLLQDVEQSNCSAWTTCCECVEDLWKNGMPPHFVSDTIFKVLTTGIRDYFASISELLNKKMRYIFFEEDGEINEFLDTEMIELYNKLVNGALTKSFAEQIPAIDKLLNAQMKDILPDVVVQELNKVDNFLKCTISGCCREVGDESQCRVEVFRKDPRPNEKTTYCCDPTVPFPPVNLDDQIEYVEDATICRRVINKHKCYNEKFREAGNRKQCCTDGMAQWIKAHSEDYLKEKTKDYITEPLNKWTEDKICEMGLSTECANLNTCFIDNWPYRIFKPESPTLDDLKNLSGAGYETWQFPVPDLNNYSKTGPPTPSPGKNIGIVSGIVAVDSFVPDDLAYNQPIPGECVPLTPDDINNLTLDVRIPAFEFLDVKNFRPLPDRPNTPEGFIEEIRDFVKENPPTEPFLGAVVQRKIQYITITKNDKEKICRGAGYQWQCDIRSHFSSIPCCFDVECPDGHSCEGAINDCMGDPDCEVCDTAKPQGICKKTFAEIDWDFDKTDCQCVDANELTQDIKGAVDAVVDIGGTGRRVLGGLMRYGSQFLAAFIDTLVHTAIEYAKVMIEDRIVAPFKDGFNTIVGFQKGIGKFLEKSVKQLLPAQISEVLQGNLDQVITDTCEQLRKLPEGEANVSIRLPLPKGVTWEDQSNPALFEDISISPKTRKTMEQAFCRTKTHLHTTVMGELSALPGIGTDIGNLLNRTLERHLNSLCPDEPPACPNDNWNCGAKQEPPHCVTDWLNKSLAETLWPGFTGLKELLEATPKQTICGELVTYNQVTPDGKIKFGARAILGGDSIKQKCDAVKGLEKGILPTVDNDKLQAVLKGPNLDAQKAEKNILVPWCHFIYTACENPFTGLVGASNKLTTSAGEFIKKVAENLCSLAAKEAAHKGCLGTCLGPHNPDRTMKDDTNCPAGIKDNCGFCNFVLHNTIAFSLFYTAVREEFWLPDYGIDNHIYPSPANIPVGSDLAKSKAEEANIYRWLLVYFPLLESEIRDVAYRRGFTPNDPNSWSQILATRTSHNINEQSIGAWSEGVLRQLVAWRLGGVSGQTPTLKDVLTNMPFGIIKPAKPGEDTLLVPRSTEKKNFLDKTSYQLLKNYACKEIERSYKVKYPNLTFEALARTDRPSIPGILTSYTMESVGVWTIAKRLELIASFQTKAPDPPVDNDLRNSYLFCKMLDLTPAQALGLDQVLKTYIRPKEFIILFDLIDKEMEPEERPEELNRVLDYLRETIPTGVLRDIGGRLPPGRGSAEFDYLFTTPVSNFGALDYDDQFRVALGAHGPALRGLFEGAQHPLPPPDAYYRAPDIEFITGSEGEEERVHGVLANMYYLTHHPDDITKFKVYYSQSNAQKILAAAITYLETKLENQLKKGAMDKKIIDIVCEHPEMQEIDEDGNLKSLCDWKYGKKEDGWTELQNKFLKKTPIALLVEKLTAKVGLPPLTDPKFTLMDMLAGNSVLGERYLDTLFRWLGLEGTFFKAVQFGDNVRGWVDYGVNTGVAALQQGLETALLEYPKEAGAALANWLSERMGRKLSYQVTGTCTDKITENGVERPITANDCRSELGEVYREADGKKECCSMGEGLVCKARCRNLPSNELCDELAGEKVMNITQDGQDVRMCCFEKQGGSGGDVCIKHRRINADLSVCRITDDLKTTEKEGTVTSRTGKIYATCSRKEDYKEGDAEAAKHGGFCCTTVSECVATKFADHMEAMADMIAEGFLPVKLKK